MCDLGNRGIVLCRENKGAGQLHDYCTADQCHLKSRFSHDVPLIFLHTFPCVVDRLSGGESQFSEKLTDKRISI